MSQSVWADNYQIDKEADALKYEASATVDKYSAIIVSIVVDFEDDSFFDIIPDDNGFLIEP